MWFKKKLIAPTITVVMVNSMSMSGGKSIYEIKDYKEYFKLVDTRAVIFMTEDNLLIQETEGVVLTCQLSDELLQQFMSSMKS
jgi:hypothetical protein